MINTIKKLAFDTVCVVNYTTDVTPGFKQFTILIFIYIGQLKAGKISLVKELPK